MFYPMNTAGLGSIGDVLVLSNNVKLKLDMVQPRNEHIMVRSIFALLQLLSPKSEAGVEVHEVGISYHRVFYIIKTYRPIAFIFQLYLPWLK